MNTANAFRSPLQSSADFNSHILLAARAIMILLIKCNIRSKLLSIEKKKLARKFSSMKMPPSLSTLPKLSI